MKQQLISLMILFSGISTAGAQTYAARTDLTAQAYPGSIPCPGSSCAGGGALNGANFSVTPTDFNLPIIRLTDASTPTAPFGNAGAWFQNCGGTAQANPMDVSDTRFSLCEQGNIVNVFSWNAATSTATRLYSLGSGGCATPGNLFFSFTRPDIAYAVGYIPNGPNQDIAFCQYDVTSSSTEPTIANGKVTVLVNLSTCVSALGNLTINPYVDDISVSADDNTFAAIVSSAVGQGTAVYMVAWHRTKGCRVWETDTGAVTGSFGGSSTGTIAINDRFFVHGGRIGKGSRYFMSSIQSCISSCGAGNNDGIFLWDLATLNAQVIQNGGFAHLAVGYNKLVADNPTTVNGVFHQQNYITYNMGNTSSFTNLPSSWPPSEIPWSQHNGWSNDNPLDSAPSCATTETNAFAPTNAWDNEIVCVTTNGSGIVWRIAHTYATYLSQFFNAANAIGAPSQDGKYFFWSTDWDGMLGKTDNVTTACTIGTNCRADVFMIALPLAYSAMSGSSTLKGSASIH